LKNESKKREEFVICPKCNFVQEKRVARIHICEKCGSLFDPVDDGQWCVDPTAKINGIERARKRRSK